MSRSYRKPYYTDQSTSKPGTTKKAKRDANRAVRAANKKVVRGDERREPKNGKAYRKESCSWNIRDWSIHSPKDKKAYRK